ncbi:hypothetical protein HH308_11165 [Gordonia sp. TBRC 11910]|uniref:Secreted protein n=1 Tax=Gordonia asplenii TaxID=2725283 RepID=A0A848KZD5_9ACTN|nr:hypothetical protein [Gordonia asplenii]NMO01773.1 hypothetical protein [Gordonia asplenii]
MTHHIVSLAFAAVLTAGTAAVTAPTAAAAVDCGTYTAPNDSQARPLVITIGAVSCGHARNILDDMFAGKGTRLNRQELQVGSYRCTGNDAGASMTTGVDLFCVGNGTRFELRAP